MCRPARVSSAALNVAYSSRWTSSCFAGPECKLRLPCRPRKSPPLGRVIFPPLGQELGATAGSTSSVFLPLFWERLLFPVSL